MVAEVVRLHLRALTKNQQTMINELSQKIHANNVKKGFYDEPKNIGEMLALIHSEVSEALECDRKDKYCPLNPMFLGMLNDCNNDVFNEEFEAKIKDTFHDELADIMIRVMDLAAHKDIDLEAHIEAKMRYNSLRPYKHGKKY